MEALDLEAQVTFVFGSQKFLWHVTRIISCQLREKNCEDRRMIPLQKENDKNHPSREERGT